MEWSEVILGLLTTVLGGGVGVLATIKSARKKADAEAVQAQADAQKALETIWAARLDQMREEIDYEREMNKELMERNKELIERMTDKENRFQEQTQVLRRHVAEVIELTRHKGDLEVELANVRCEDYPCPFRRPPNSHTPPPPNVSKAQWHRERNDYQNTEKPDQ